jgi:hypothetical protein
MTPTIVDLLLLLTSLGLRDGSALDLAADVRAVVATEAPLLEDRASTARLLAVWAYHESAGRSVVGDHGAACGVLQLHEVARQGVPCAEILADRRVGLRLGLAWMRRMAEQCGSVPAGLRAYASGTCAGTPRARRLVESRLREAL